MGVYDQEESVQVELLVQMSFKIIDVRKVITMYISSKVLELSMIFIGSLLFKGIRCLHVRQVLSLNTTQIILTFAFTCHLDRVLTCACETAIADGGLCPRILIMKLLL